MQFLEKFDCEDERIVFLGATYYNKNMGAGEVISSMYKLDSIAWEPVMPNSHNKVIFDAVCAKK